MSAETNTNWLFLILPSVAVCVLFSNVLMLGPLLKDLATDFRTTIPVAGQLVAAGSLGWAIMGPVAGAMADRYGSKRPLFVGLYCGSLLQVAASFATDLTALFALRVLGMTVGALAGPAAWSIVAENFTGPGRGKALGWTISSVSLAPVIGVPLLALAAESGDWRWSFRAVAMAMVVVGILIHWKLPDRRPGARAKVGGGIRAVIGSKSVIGLLAANAFERLAYGAVGTFLAAFWIESYALSVGQAGAVVSLVGIAALAGVVWGGRVAGKWPATGVFVYAQLAAAVAAIPLLLYAPSLWLSIIIALVFATSNAASRPSYMWLVTQVGPRVRATTIGLTSTGNQMGLVVGAALGGLVIGATGYGGVSLMASAALVAAVLTCRLAIRPDDLTALGNDDPHQPSIR